ncbi:F390 synthetase-related protein [Kosakonia sp.]|uniref:F390 synthetase-related protein n=1 Tax=Kosakonia sp. TaxID=1916651 RepID=UPI00289CAB9D|nr:F390 synthetase-related protein [Kosakonia sp.]
MNLAGLLGRYFLIRRRRFLSRASLEAWQAKRMAAFRHRVLVNSPWFKPWLDKPFTEWPLMDKALMMTHFDAMNTAGLRRDELLACALESEHSRDFSPTVGRFSVGLSSGTSGQRGLFVVSPQERQIWAAGVLAKSLPDGLFARERVALFLRADNQLYQSVNSRWLTLEFYDLLQPFAQQIARLQQQSPTLIVAPAQVLRAIALAVRADDLALKVKKVISVAEVLEPQDRALLRDVFGEVGEIYQATEGFLAATCAHGTLHLNEEFVHIEPQWIDERRFVPVITDFTRRTQPIVRYRLDDVLTVRDTPCPCGSVTRAIAHIEGRHDDQLLLSDERGRWRPVFADACSRVLAQALPLEADYRLVQTGAAQIHLTATCDAGVLVSCRDALINWMAGEGIATETLRWTLSAGPIDGLFTHKRRRIIRQWNGV